MSNCFTEQDAARPISNGLKQMRCLNLSPRRDLKLYNSTSVLKTQTNVIAIISILHKLFFLFFSRFKLIFFMFDNSQH